MSSVLVEPEAKLDRGGPGGGGDRKDGDGGGGGGRRDEPLAFDTARLGLWLLLATITMLFAAFTSAYIVRRAASDWAPIRVPPLLWLNTVILVSSSLTMELARRSRRLQAFRRWLGMTFLLGLAFLGGQVLAWRELAAQGVYLSSNPHSSFFYVLTGAHAVHVLGGIGALVYLAGRLWRENDPTPTATAPRLTATYWHFVDGLWAYLFVVLFVI
jgi:cytochrome c oxidase subunit 3